jgi:glycogen(starch) synthase
MSLSDDLVENRLFVEVGWEVCWQLGGIYTVLRSKAPMTTKKWGDRYCLVGPYNAKSAATEFEEIPRTGPFGRACELMESRGIRVKFGRWLITGKPQAVLIDYMAHSDRIGSSNYFLWRDHNIEAGNEQEVNDVVLFGFLAAEFFQCLSDAMRESDADDAGSASNHHNFELPILAHFHEWMAAVALLEIRKRQLPIATVFTTHATLLGRYLAGNDPNFYHYLPQIDPFGAAKAYNVANRFGIERAAAWCADVFSTVSDITGYEAEHFLGRRPDILLPNGLNIQRFSAVHEFQNLHVQYKKQINEFVMGHFFPSYTFDLDKTMYIFTSGRYEYRNKGFDMFLEGLARLNWKLKNARSGVTVVAFIISRAPNRGISAHVLKSQMLFKELRNTIRSVSNDIGEKMLMCQAQGKQLHIDDLVDDYSQLRLKRMTHAWKQSVFPSVVTHDMNDDGADPVLNHIRAMHMFNNPDDPVKIVFHPEFMSGTSPLVGLDYDQFVRGCHLGVFPSYYEPWGYTPMECAALGIPSITSDLAGFGTYVRAHIPDHDQRGLFVVDRRYRTFDESANQLADSMMQILTSERRDRIDLRNRVEATSPLFDWKQLCTYHWEAHKMALRRAIESSSKF